jgi:hypothetical protein
MSYLTINILSWGTRYRAGGRPRYITASDRLPNGLKSSARWFNSRAAGKSGLGARCIWKLRNISFLPRQSGEMRWQFHECR